MTKRRQKNGNTTLTEGQAMYLEIGLCLDGFHPDYNHPRMGGPLPRDCPFPTPDAMRVAWEENRDHLMAKALPGERPWAFFRFATKPRLRIPMLFGFGSDGWRYYPPGTPGLTDARATEVEETEADYLTRTGLWADGEREAWQDKR